MTKKDHAMIAAALTKRRAQGGGMSPWETRLAERTRRLTEILGDLERMHDELTAMGYDWLLDGWYKLQSEVAQELERWETVRREQA